MSEPNGAGRFSLTDLAGKAKATTIKSAAVRAGSDNPFLLSVKESWMQDREAKDSGWREVEVPATMLDELIASMRSLSAYFGDTGEKIGVHLRVEFYPDGAKEGDDPIEVGPGRFDEIPRDDRTVWFKYTGRDRMKRGRRRTAPPQQAASGQVDVAEDREEDSELQPA